MKVIWRLATTIQRDIIECDEVHEGWNIGELPDDLYNEYWEKMNEIGKIKRKMSKELEDK
jgi:hypothetical protein